MAGRLVRDLRRRGCATELGELLSSSRWQTVRDAAGALGELGADEALPRLRDCTRHPHWRVRVAATVAVGRIGSVEAGELLSDLLIASVDDDGLVASRASAALGELRSRGISVPDDATRCLLDRLDSLPERRPWPTVVWLGQLRDGRAVDPLMDLLEPLVADASGGGRDIWREGHLHEVLRALAACGDLRIADAIVALRGRVLADVEREADATLIVLGDRRGLDHLLAQVGAGTGRSRAYAGTLAQLEQRWTLPALRELAGDDDPSIAVGAAIAVYKLGRPEAAGQLRSFLEHPDRRDHRRPGVALSGLRVRAALALGDPLELPLKARTRQ